MNTFLNFLPEQKILNGRYILKDALGSGKTSTVFKCLDNQIGESKAIKIFEDNARLAFKKELKINKKLSEINSTSHIKCYESGIGFLSEKGESMKKMYAILELGNHGSLFDALERTKNGFSEDVCKLFLLQILNGLNDLHQNGICHRDLKPENMVLVGKNYDLKLCDFGYSTKFLKENNKMRKLKRQLGTIYYCAPEILEGKNYNGEKIDIFSIGALLFVLMTKNFGFNEAKIYNISSNDKSKLILYNLIKEKKYDKYWEIMETTFKIVIDSQKFKNLYLKLVAYEPGERPTIEEIKNDEWMQDILNASQEELSFLRNKMISEINIQSL